MKRACVIGWPVEHSRSPAIHRYWLELYGIDGAYEKEAVRPEEFASFLGSLSDRGYAGANVTLPHKMEALRLATKADESARAIGAANMLWLDGAGLLNASNTDAYGFMDKADIIEAEVKNRIAYVTVKFVSELISVTRDAEGEVVEGDPKKVREVTDIWTFAHEVGSRNPNWKLVATEAAN